MKKTLFVIVLAAMASGCGEKVVEVSLVDACSPANADKVVVTSGYLADKAGTGVLCTNPGTSDRPTCGYAVLTSPDGLSAFAAFIDQGIGKNKGEKPAAGYKNDDIKIRDDKGDVISLSDKVKLTGKMTYLSELRRCTMTVDKIER